MDAGSWRNSGVIFDVENRERRGEELESRMAAPEFWSDPESAQKTVLELKNLRRVYEPYRALEREVQDAEGLIALVLAEPDESLASELERQSKDLLPRIQALELQSLLSEESDAHGAIVTIHPGAGGTESQ